LAGFSVIEESRAKMALSSMGWRAKIMRPLLLILLISSSAIISNQQSASAAPAPRATWTSGTPATSICATGHVYLGQAITATSRNNGNHTYSWKSNGTTRATTQSYTISATSGHSLAGQTLTSTINTGNSVETACLGQTIKISNRTKSSQLEMSGGASTVANGEKFTSPFKFQGEDNEDSTYWIPVVSVTRTGGGTLSGTTPSFNVDENGGLTFPDLKITGQAGQKVTLTFSFATTFGCYISGSGDCTKTKEVTLIGDPPGLSAALTPTFGTPQATADGFIVNVTNYDANFGWAASITNSGPGAVTKGTAIGTSLPLTVTGLNPLETTTIKVDTTRSGYTPGTANIESAASEGAARNPTFGTPTPTDDGFTVNVTNYNASYEWSAVIANNGPGSVALGTPSGPNLPITVSGLSPSQSTTITVRTTRSNYANGSAGKLGSAKISDLDPSVGVVGKWNSVATSADGQIVLLSGIKTKLYVSKDAGVTWRARATSQNWIATTVSDDGSILAAAVSGGQIYTSSDSGVTWSARDSNRNWRSMAASADGTKLVATVYGGQIYASTDSGATWSAKATNLNWRAIASSANGVTLAAVVYNGEIWKSTNSGATWAAITNSTRKWSGISISDDGNVLAAVESGGTVYVSRCGGCTWASPASINNVVKDLWNSIACNSDCSKIVLSSTSGRSAMVDNTGTYIADSMVYENFLTWSCVAIDGSGSLVIGVTNSGAIRTKSANANALITQRVASASVNFRDIAISTNGLKIITGAWNSYLFTSTQSYSDLAKLDSSPATSNSVPTALWRAVASSSDGVKLVAAVYNGKIYTSTNSGANWTQRGVNQPWSAIASSDDGVKLVAATLGGNLYNSINSGATWTKRAVVAQWSAVAASSDGSKFVATSTEGKIYTSTDSGVTWASRAPSNLNWSSVASNDNGDKLVVTDNDGKLGGQIWISDDSGFNWSKVTTTPRLWSSVASSDDGAKLVATVASGKIYTSTNSGTTWISRNYVGNWKKVVSSSNGSNLFAIDYGKSIWASTNSGATWSIISAENWSK